MPSYRYNAIDHTGRPFTGTLDAENLEAVRIQTEEQQTVREAVEQLADRCRTLLEMLYFDTRSLSYEEISQTLNIPVPSIGPTRARCLEKLKTLLRRRGIK